MEAILIQLAHVRRHDAVVNACQTVAETLLFYHPAVWWLSSRVRAEREHCCDDIALEMSGDPFAYAEALAELESWRVANVPLAMAATGGPLLSRVARVLGRPPRPARVGAARPPPWSSRSSSPRARCNIVARQPACVPTPQPRRHPSVADAVRSSVRTDGHPRFHRFRISCAMPTGCRSRIVGGPAWLDTDAFELTTTLDHAPRGETPALVRNLLEERFGLAVHESTIEVPSWHWRSRGPTARGAKSAAATGGCFDQRAWVAAGAPRLSTRAGERTRFCGEWDSGIDYQRTECLDGRSGGVDARRFAPAIRPTS